MAVSFHAGIRSLPAQISELVALIAHAYIVAGICMIMFGILLSEFE